MEGGDVIRLLGGKGVRVKQSFSGGERGGIHCLRAKSKRCFGDMTPGRGVETKRDGRKGNRIILLLTRKKSLEGERKVGRGGRMIGGKNLEQLRGNHTARLGSGERELMGVLGGKTNFTRVLRGVFYFMVTV